MKLFIQVASFINLLVFLISFVLVIVYSFKTLEPTKTQRKSRRKVDKRTKSGYKLEYYEISKPIEQYNQELENWKTKLPINKKRLNKYLYLTFFSLIMFFVLGFLIKFYSL